MVEEGTEKRIAWSPRLSRAFQGHLRETYTASGKRRYSDRTVNRMMAHLKTFSKWVHKLSPFPLGEPMAKIKLLAVGTGLDIERALTTAEKRKILDAADLLVEIGGRSKDRNRYRKTERPRRRGYRPYRNRAIIYALIGTGMRRAAVCQTNLNDVDFRREALTVIEKGELEHTYQVSREACVAIRDYLEHERDSDNERWCSPALFLPAVTVPSSSGRLSRVVVNQVWNEICAMAGVEGKTPHSARHAMGKHLIEKKGNIAAVQRQLGHKNAAYSMQYSRVTAQELQEAINEP